VSERWRFPVSPKIRTLVGMTAPSSTWCNAWTKAWLAPNDARQKAAATKVGVDAFEMNWLAHAACVLLGTVATCRAHGVPVQAYLAWAFERLGTHRDVFGLQLEDVTPAAFKKSLG
jgi:hypothetical protein